MTHNILINKILVYSAKKIKANPPLLYSTLNPDTNSDSPSAKSKGVRFVSANLDTIQIILTGKNKNTNHKLDWKIIKSIKFNLKIKNKKDNKIKDNLTSYEIVWATDRNPPNKE